MKQAKKALYMGTMAVLYVICDFGWNLYLKYWKAFAEVDAKYTEQYGEDMLAEVAAAKEMPDLGQRRSNTSTSKTKLAAAAKKGVNIWKRLERLVEKIYSADEIKDAVRSAGGDHYAEASKGKYEEVSLLLTAGAAFIASNADKLTNNGEGMPATFPADFNTAKKDFDAQYTGLGGVKRGATDGGDDKIDANNAIYLSLTSMLKDADTLFEEEKNIRSQFTFISLRKLVTTDNPTGIHFTVSDSNKKRIATAVIKIEGADDKGGEVNKKGVLDVKLAKGKYIVTVTCEGYVTYTREVTVDTGVMHRATITLQKLITTA